MKLLFISLASLYILYLIYFNIKKYFIKKNNTYLFNEEDLYNKEENYYENSKD